MSAVKNIIIFGYGVSFFYVKTEPAVFDFVTVSLAIFFYREVAYFSTQPVVTLYIVSVVFVLLLEMFLIGGIGWSLVSLYLVVLMLVFASMVRAGWSVRFFIYGSAAASAALLVELFLRPDNVLSFGIRLTGYFKDPNVLAPTALALWYLAREQGIIIRLSLLSVASLALSRATFLALFLVSGIQFLLKYRRYAIFLAISALVAVYPSLIALEGFFEVVGRGGLVNNYDSDRLGNWIYILEAWSTSIMPLGPGWSELNGYATHNTYVRVLTEQGLVPFLIFLALLVYAAWCVRHRRIVLLALLAVLINAIVVDATHWRILFVVVGVALGCGHWRGALRPKH